MQKILVIDDEKDAVNTIKDFLSSRDYDVITAFDGDEGLKKFDSENPDLVICDIKMPKKDGFQFLQELRANKKWVPVIIITALTEPSNILKSYQFEADYYISKPLNMEEILKAVQIMLSLIPLRKK
jgi:two-component system alkaline phosphatase synthesis response regulator PhoP